MIPFVKENTDAQLVHGRAAWTQATELSLGKHGSVVTFLGNSWRQPPFTDGKGIVFKVYVRQTVGIIHFPDTGFHFRTVLLAIKLGLRHECFASAGDLSGLEMLGGTVPLEKRLHNFFIDGQYSLNNPLDLVVY